MTLTLKGTVKAPAVEHFEDEHFKGYQFRFVTFKKYDENLRLFYMGVCPPPHSSVIMFICTVLNLSLNLL